MEVARRTYKQYGVTARRITLALHDEDWALVEQIAHSLGWTIPHFVEEMLRAHAENERNVRSQRPADNLEY